MRVRDAVRFVLGLGSILFLVADAGELTARAATPTQLRIEAESEVQGPGVVNYGYGISYVDNGDWVRFARVDFGACGFYQSFSAFIATPYSGNLVHVRLDSQSGREVATLATAATGAGWQNFAIETTALQAVTGLHDLYLVFDGTPNVNNPAQGSGNGIGNVDWIQLLNNFSFQASTSAVCDPVDVLLDRVAQLSTELTTDSSQLAALQLQTLLDRQQKFVQTLSNILKTISDTTATIVNNIK